MKKVAAMLFGMGWVKPGLPGKLLSAVLLAIAGGLLVACSGSGGSGWVVPGSINRVEVAPGTHIVCDTSLGTPCGVDNIQTVTIRVWGQGKCDSIGLDFGDGSPTVFSPPFDFGQAGASKPFEVSHVYRNAWPGPKTIHAYSASNCIGESRQTIQVMHSAGGGDYHANYILALAQPFLPLPGQPANSITECALVPNVVPLRTNTKVTVTTNPNPDIKINFGCAFGGCVYGPDGKPDSVASSNFYFPGLREYSLVLRIGGQVIQGSSHFLFVTDHAGPLEVCVNDDKNSLAENTGAWGIAFVVDESQAH